MRSESTSALGQPSETNPTLGAALLRLDAGGFFPGAVLVAVRGFSTAFFVAVFILGRSGIVGLGGRAIARRRKRVGGRKVREREVAEQVTGLLLHLLLHFEEGVGALLEVTAHQALDRRALHL